MSPDAITAALRAFLEEAAEEHGLAAAYLFGSVARGTAHSRSDVDVAVLYQEEPPAGLARFHLESELERHLRLPAQLIVLNRAPADLVHRVLRDGRILLDRDRSRRLAFEVRSRGEYLDLAPLRQLYRRMGNVPP